jgi:thiol-disulfide isomerase/thioredoxin
MTRSAPSAVKLASLALGVAMATLAVAAPQATPPASPPPPANPAPPAEKPATPPAEQKPADATPPATAPAPSGGETAPKAPDQPAAEPAAKPPIAGTMWDQLYKDLDGKEVDLAEFAGKPMVIELWATWCGPCRRQREIMHQLSEEFPEIVFVAASTDQGGGNTVKIFLAQQKSPKTSRVVELLATQALQSRLNKLNNSTSIPKVAYVNKKGQLVDVSVGTQNPTFMKTMLKNMTKK